HTERVWPPFFPSCIDLHILALNKSGTSIIYIFVFVSFKYEKVLLYLLPISYSLVFFFGLSLNAMVLFFITFRTKRWTPSTIYMLNLTVCDILYVFTLPFLIYNWVKDWPFGEAVCKICAFLFQANHYGSILFLSAISLNRFIGICYPVHSLSWLGVKRAQLVSVGVWACVLSCQAPVLYFAGTKTSKHRSFCYGITNPELLYQFLVYGSVISVVTFVLPFMLVMVCYGLMVRKLLEPSWGSGEGQQGLRFRYFFYFFLFSIPVTNFVFDLHSVSQDQITCKMGEAFFIAFQVTWLMASANSIMDPILYFMVGQDFRKTMMKKKQKESEKNLRKSQNTVLMASL
uniref:P2Y purinoceptor 2 n=1 Tax=Gadus morhua TaxID=8049 RepID=A0A8C4ZCU4_GADMO